MIKLGSKLVLLFMLILLVAGCTGLGFNFSEKRTAIITRGQYQIAVTGDLTPEATDNIIKVVESIGRYPYRDAHFNENLNVNLLASDTETSSTSSISQMDSTRSQSYIYDRGE